MFTERAGFDGAVWREIMELQSRKEVIERWLSESGTPAQLVEVLQEMLVTTERQLRLLRNQAPDEKPIR